MSITKLKFTPMSRDLQTEFVADEFDVPFNPHAYSVTKTVSWGPSGAARTTPTTASGATASPQIYLDAPTLNFNGGQSRQLTLNLFFDATETPNGDVRTQTSKIVALTRKDRDQKCPRPCKISWGSASTDNDDFPFTGVITNLQQNFVLFSADGKPLRANLTVTLLEYPNPELNQHATDPELTTRIVKRGDTVSSISGAVYGDPKLWRTIAEANGLDDPRRLEVGSRLTIPKKR